jgi:hypothetical protein
MEPVFAGKLRNDWVFRKQDPVKPEPPRIGGSGFESGGLLFQNALPTTLSG